MLNAHRRSVLLVTFLVASGLVRASALPASSASSLWGSAKVIGGVKAAWHIARNADSESDAPAFLIELARYRFYATLDQGVVGPVAALPPFWKYLTDLRAALAPLSTGIKLDPGLEQNKKLRQQVETALDLLGLRLISDKKQYKAELRKEDESRRHVAWALVAGIDAPAVMERLNKGETVGADAFPIHDESVPLPVPDLWKAVLSIEPDALADAVVNDPKAHFLYVGLAASDLDTLEWLGGHPATFKRLHDDQAQAWAAFGRSVHIRSNAVITPGRASTPIWEDLVGAKTSSPDEFMRKLLSKDDGRLAYFFDAVSHLDEARQSFLLGEQLGEATNQTRIKFVRRVYDRWASATSKWNPVQQPMARPDPDPALIAAVLDVKPGGVVGPDWWPHLLERVSGDSSWPKSADVTLKDLRVRPADAGWTFDWLLDNSDQVLMRFRWLSFLQRNFPEADRKDAPAIEIALRALQETPTLALALERMGVKDPAVFEATARAARAITRGGAPVDVIPVLRAWQGALGTLEQLSRHGVLREPVQSQLLLSLARAVPPEINHPSGVIGRWFLEELLPKSGVATDAGIPTDRMVLTGLLTAGTQPRTLFRWESLDYEADLIAPTLKSAAEIREQVKGPSIGTVIALNRADHELEKGLSSLEQIGPLTKLIEPAGALLTGATDGEGKPVSVAADLDDAVKNLQKIRAVKDLPKAVKYRSAVQQAIDYSISDVLPSLAYALALSPSPQPAALYADAPRLHNFGSGAEVKDWATIAWSTARITPIPRGGGTLLTGSLLGIDLVRAADRLFRMSGGEPPAGMFVPDADYAVLAARTSLYTRGANWDADGKAIVSAVAKGRARLDSWRQAAPDAHTLSAELDRAAFSEWRRNATVWLSSQGKWDDLDKFILPSEIFRLGTDQGLPPAWGEVGRPFDGSWCLRAPLRRPMEDWLGHRDGLLAGQGTDLAIQLTRYLADLDVPASLMEPILQMAIQDGLDQTFPFGADDWAAFAWARKLTRERVEDYLQGLRQHNLIGRPHAPGKTGLPR